MCFPFQFADERVAGADDFLLIFEGRPGMFLGEKVEVRFAAKGFGVGHLKQFSERFAEFNEA